MCTKPTLLLDALEQRLDPGGSLGAPTFRQNKVTHGHLASFQVVVCGKVLIKKIAKEREQVHDGTVLYCTFFSLTT